MVRDIGCTELGKRCVELTAFCIHPSARGAGRGDSLLDFLEQARFAVPETCILQADSPQLPASSMISGRLSLN